MFLLRFLWAYNWQQWHALIGTIKYVSGKEPHAHCACSEWVDVRFFNAVTVQVKCNYLGCNCGKAFFGTTDFDFRLLRKTTTNEHCS